MKLKIIMVFTFMRTSIRHYNNILPLDTFDVDKFNFSRIDIPSPSFNCSPTRTKVSNSEAYNLLINCFIQGVILQVFKEWFTHKLVFLQFSLAIIKNLIVTHRNHYK